MSSPRRHTLRGVITAAILALPLASPARAADHSAHQHEGPHVRLTTPREATPADQARYDALVATLRRDLARYRDIEVARAEGFEPFMPGVGQREYHFTRRLNGFRAAFTFDPEAPTSLLYRREADARYTLTGVMYTAPASASEAELDARVPLGMAPWHQHVNLCVPGWMHRERWGETRDGQPLFGPKSPIATEADCDAVGGHFVPRLFGWMVHVEAFADATT
jgi:hypothetical protein